MVHVKFILSLDKEVENLQRERILSYDRENSGIDLILTEDVDFEPFETKIISLDVKILVIDDLSEPLPYYLYPRSSISKTPLMFANSVGIIDKTYRNELKCSIKNVSLEKYTAKKGVALCQICSSDLTPFKSIHIDENLRNYSYTGRGEGFGSTGCI